MNKKIYLLSLISVLTLFGCKNKEDVIREEQTSLNHVDTQYNIDENFEDLDFSAKELSYWLSYNKGEAKVDDSKLKISLTSEQFGGIRSVFKTKIDFSKEVYINFKGFEAANPNISLLLKMYFYDYSSKESAYIISNDVIGLNGDFSINIDNALKRYGSSSSNTELYENNELKFKNKTVSTVFYISAYNNNNSGLSNEESWIKFDSFNISYKQNKDIGELGSFNISQDGINLDNVNSSNVITRKKNSTSVSVTPKANGSPLDKSKVIFATSDMRKLPISEQGALSFNDVTNTSERVVAYPREDITLGGFFDFPQSRYSKNSGFYANVLGLWEKEDIYENSLSLFNDSNVITLNEDFIDLFESDLLDKQNVNVVNNLSAVTLVASTSTVNVINNYSGSDDDRQEALENESCYIVNALPNQNLNTTNLKLSVIKLGKNNIRLIVKEETCDASNNFPIKLEYLNSDFSKYLDNDRYLLLWNDGNNKQYCFFETKNIDSTGITKLSPSEIERSFSSDRGWDGLTTEIVAHNDVDVFRINLNLHDLTAFYAQPFLELFADKYSTKESEYIKIDFSKKVQLIIDFGDCENMNYNLRFFRIGGRFVDEYWRDEGKYYTDLSIGNELLYVDLYHYANKGNIPNMINMAISKSLPVELCFDISLKEKTFVGANGHLDIKNIYILYE